MSKRNRENRARKVKAGAKKRKPNPPPVPPEYMSGFDGDGPDAVRGRRRLAILMPLIMLGNQPSNKYTEGMPLSDGSMIIGPKGGKRGYISGEQVPPLIAEASRELSIPVDEIIEVWADAEASGLVEIVESEPGIVERKAREKIAKALGTSS